MSRLSQAVESIQFGDISVALFIVNLVLLSSSGHGRTLGQFETSYGVSIISVPFTFSADIVQTCYLDLKS